MCGRYPPVSAPVPEKALADLMRKDLGVEIDPKALGLFIKHRWQRVSVLAHSIHENDE